MTTAEASRLPIALVISDIDGTLITSNHELTEATKRTAAALSERGIGLSLSSSRPPRAIRPLADALGLRSPFAAFNGAVVATADGTVMASSIIPAATIAAVKKIADGLGLSVWLYDEEDWWVAGRAALVDRDEHTSGVSPKIDVYADRL